MPKLHKLTESQVDDRVLSAVIDEHRQTRHSVRTGLVCIAVNAAENAADATDQQAVLWSLSRLRRAGKIARQHPDGTWLPVAGAEPVATPAEAAPDKPKKSEPEAAPEIRDPMPGEGLEVRDPMPGEGLKIRDPMLPIPHAGEVRKAYANAKKAMSGLSQAAQPENVRASGLKFDAEKPRMELLIQGMPHALEAVGAVLTFGAEKYAAHSWKHVEDNANRYWAAKSRHELARAKGEQCDPETGLLHLAHEATNALFLLELALTQGEEGCTHG